MGWLQGQLLAFRHRAQRVAEEGAAGAACTGVAYRLDRERRLTSTSTKQDKMETFEKEGRAAQMEGAERRALPMTHMNCMPVSCLGLLPELDTMAAPCSTLSALRSSHPSGPASTSARSRALPLQTPMRDRHQTCGITSSSAPFCVTNATSRRASGVCQAENKDGTPPGDGPLSGVKKVGGQRHLVQKPMHATRTRLIHASAATV